MSTKQMTLTAMLTALLCITGPLTLPLGPIPLSLTTAVLMLMALLLGAGRATLCCSVYLLTGLVGLPVFSGFTGGLAAFAGPNGGFLLGYLPMTALCGLLCQSWTRPALQGLSLAAGTLLLYLLGTVWYTWQTNTPLLPALTACVLPFLPGDALKIAAVLTGGRAIKARLKKASLL